MGLASPGFLFLFLVPMVALNAAVSRRRPEWTPPLLLWASVGYCILTEPRALPWLAGSILLNFGLVHRILREAEGSSRRAGWVALGVVLNVLPLLWFKFRVVGFPGEGTFGSASSAVVMTAGIPLGVAFYSLHQITGLFDVQRRDAVRLSPVRHALMVGMFAQLSAGPIIRYRDAAPQYARLGQAPVGLGAILRGGSLIVMGLAKKAVLADPLGAVVNSIYAGAASNSVTPLEAWYAAWGFLLQLYLDFSAYSDIAIGIGLCFGIRLPVNFDSPLKSASVGEYVNRWHVSLMVFTREYVFNPVFSRLRRLRFTSAQLRNLVAWSMATLLSFAVIGAWHAPTLTILLYSLVVGGMVVLVQIQSVRSSARRARAPSGWRRSVRGAARRVGLLAAASLAALLFRADTASTLRNLLVGLVDVQRITLGRHAPAFLAERFPSLVDPAGLMPLVDSWTRWNLLALGVATVVVLAMPNTMQIFGFVSHPKEAGGRWAQWRPDARWGVVAGVLLVAWLVALASEGGGAGFVYERF